MVKKRQRAEPRPARTITWGAVILDIQQRLSGAVRQAARTAFDIDLAEVSFQYPPRVELGDLALTAPFDLAKTLRRKPREIAERLAEGLAVRPRREAGRGRGRRLRQPLPRPRRARRRARRRPRRRPEGRGAPGPRHRRAHEHQPQQGGPHRAPAQRVPRRHLRAAPPPPRLRRRRAELHRRHRRAGRGRGGGLPAHREEVPRRGRDDRREVRLLLLGPLRAGGRLLRGRAGEEGPAGRGPPRHRGRAATTRPASPSTWRGGSWTATSPRWRGSGSATTSSPTRATSSASTSGTAPSSS